MKPGYMMWNRVINTSLVKQLQKYNVKATDNPKKHGDIPFLFLQSPALLSGQPLSQNHVFEIFRGEPPLKFQNVIKCYEYQHVACYERFYFNFATLRNVKITTCQQLCC